MTHGTPNHPFHLVRPSPWPALTSLSALLTAVGAVWYMHASKPWMLALGLATLLFVVAGWWRDVVRESVIDKAHTDAVSHGLRMGMVLFIASELMFFVAFFWAFFNASSPLFSQIAQPVWPPQGIEPLDAWTIPFLNTLILLTSGATVTYAHRAAQLGDQKKMVAALGLTVLLGVIFLGFQAFEYFHANFGFRDGIFPSTFYMATGFHGFHVFVGVSFLTVCFFRARKGHFTAEKHIGLEAAAWYWHFVDVVWLFLFTFVYWWGGNA